MGPAGGSKKAEVFPFFIRAHACHFVLTKKVWEMFPNNLASPRTSLA